jgi:hypothetical protein
MKLDAINACGRARGPNTQDHLGRDSGACRGRRGGHMRTPRLFRVRANRARLRPLSISACHRCAPSRTPDAVARLKIAPHERGLVVY